MPDNWVLWALGFAALGVVYVLGMGMAYGFFKTDEKSDPIDLAIIWPISVTFVLIVTIGATIFADCVWLERQLFRVGQKFGAMLDKLFDRWWAFIIRQFHSRE